MKEPHNLFDNTLFNVEHALVMYALSNCILRAEDIYDKQVIANLMSAIKKCHIYIIGFQPKIYFIEAKQHLNRISLKFSILGHEYTIENNLPDGARISIGEEFYLIDRQGNKFVPNMSAIQAQLSRESNAINFEVKYIGQALGKNGSRNAIDRLLRHETLQKISLKGVPDGYQLNILLLEVHPNPMLCTMFLPHAKNNESSSSRIKAGIDKLYGTNEQEQISLYEAALIRYFSPQFNKEFKSSFPSTNIKILQDCYKKDFSAVVAEINFDDLPFKLFSDTVEASSSHIAKFDLHDDFARKVFFGK
ncbi:hypothetical protein ACM9VS_05655 [Legionella pneumophila]|uniref:hypothetical protein n=1 Tax=Legionella pneumophila TaxID=446 RepID=UPI003A4C6AF4